NADEHLADEVRREQGQPEKPLHPVLARVQKQRQSQAQRQLKEDRENREDDRVPHGRAEIGIVQDEAEVAEADECSSSRSRGLLEREDRRVSQRIKEKDGGDDEVRQKE